MFSSLVVIVATVPTACGIETSQKLEDVAIASVDVATVPTACGIETGY